MDLTGRDPETINYSGVLYYKQYRVPALLIPIPQSNNSGLVISLFLSLPLTLLVPSRPADKDLLGIN